jgi:hypothetical protein
MSYTRPPFDAADASWSGAETYTRPEFDSADASFVTSDGYQIISDGPLGSTSLVVSLAEQVQILSDGPLGSAELTVSLARQLQILSGSPLGSAELVVLLALQTEHLQLLSDGPLGSTDLLIEKRPVLEISILSSGPIGSTNLTLKKQNPAHTRTLSDSPFTGDSWLKVVFPVEATIEATGPLGRTKLLATNGTLQPFDSTYQFAIANPDGTHPITLGVCLYGTSLGIIDYSRKERDEFGNITVIERGYTDTVRYQVSIRTSDAEVVRRILASKRGRLTKYIGATEDSATTVVGYLSQFSLRVEEFMDSSLELEVEGQVIT